MIGDSRFLAVSDRRARRAEVDAILTAWTITKTKHEAMAILGAAGVPAGAVNDTLEVTQDVDLQSREMFVAVNHPTRGPVQVPGMPIRLSDSSVAVSAAPILGADTEKVLTDWAQVDAVELERLRGNGSIVSDASRS